MFPNASIYRQVLRYVLLISGIVFLSRVTRNWAVAGLALYGILSALKQRAGPTIIVFFLLSFLPMITPAIMPRYVHFTIIARLSSMAMTCALILTGDSRSGRNQIPLGTLYVYLLIASLSSIEGYCPLISQLKVLNFFLFITGIYIGTKNIDNFPKDILQIRYVILAVIVLLVYGSLATLAFPSVAYYTSMKSIVVEYGYAYADEVFQDSVGKQVLFTGITVHSQFLGPMLGCCFAWLLCDMLIAEQKISPLHITLLLPIPVMAYMTRSRLAFVVLATAVAMVALNCIPKATIPENVRGRFSNIMLVIAICFGIIAVVGEVRRGTISKWLRKTEDVAVDQRSLREAVTSSRQGKIAECLDDFHQNTLWGKGFQVDRSTKARYDSGSVSLFSASIEKGLLPVMILGETGMIGTIAFVAFLAIFFITCHARHYMGTFTLFAVYLATNMAEATFFSPAGGGGVEWILMVVGGFVIDMSCQAKRQEEIAEGIPITLPPRPSVPVEEEESGIFQVDTP